MSSDAVWKALCNDSPGSIPLPRLFIKSKATKAASNSTPILRAKLPAFLAKGWLKSSSATAAAEYFLGE